MGVTSLRALQEPTHYHHLSPSTKPIISVSNKGTMLHQLRAQSGGDVSQSS